MSRIARRFVAVLMITLVGFGAMHGAAPMRQADMCGGGGPMPHATSHNVVR
jgi:hypothetical protein